MILCTEINIISKYFTFYKIVFNVTFLDGRVQNQARVTETESGKCQ